MSFSEFLQSVSDSIARGRAKVVFVFRSYPKTWIVLFLILSVLTVVWARSGFSLDFFRSSAVEDDGGGGDGGGGGGGPTPTASPSAGPGQQSDPHAYCDFATKSCLMKTGADWNAVQCGTTGASCTPGQCRLWVGSGQSWAPGSEPSGVPACEPLSKIDGSLFPGFNDPMPVPPPFTFPDCFAIYDTSSQDPNFGTTTENTIPRILTDRPNAKLFMSAFVVNNCPWTVHFQIQVDASKKASFAQGIGKRELGLSAAESAQAFTDTMPDGYDFPSCWNSGGSERPANCARAMKIEFNMNTYTCGSLGMQTTWKHLTGSGGTGTSGGPLTLSTAMNYGRDCTGSPTERAPGSLGGGGTGSCPAIPQASAVKPAVLTVQCGTTQNVLKWQNPKTLNAAVNSVLRIATSPTGVKTTASVFGEGGCWNTFGISTYTDRSLLPGYSYTYAIKTHPNIKSNEVTCKGGVQVTTSPTPQASGSPTGSVPPTFSPTPTVTSTGTPTPGFSPTPTITATPVFTPTPTFTPSDSDIDGDGIPNANECPGYVPGTSTSTCPDTDGDGVPDILDPITSGSGVGGVQTGPGDATLLALLISALVSLAYVSYAHSPVGKRREAEAISRDQGPMDFRS